MKILIVEDNPSAALILRRTLQKSGHAVTVARDGVEAWEAFQNETFPLVISDWMMPRMDGPALCRRIREHRTVPYTYLILLTSRADQEDRLAGLSSGADDFLEKPMGRGELRVRLEIAQRILKMQEAFQELNVRLERQNADMAETLQYLEAANHRFSELFEGLPVACYSYDAEGVIHEWNRAAADLFGGRSEDVCGRTVWDVFREEDPERQRQAVARQQEIMAKALAGESVLGLETEITVGGGQPRCVLSSTIPLRDAGGHINGLISANTDITQRRLLEQQSREHLRLVHRLNTDLEAANAHLAGLALLDGLTGLKNRRAFQKELHVCHSFAVRQRLPLSAIMLDVDHFKDYNDAHGHLAGDEVLRRVGRILENGLRTHDHAARYGGEEFVLLLPATGRADALLVAERLRAAIAAFDWPLRPVTASLGVATSDPARFPLGPTDLVGQADAALYRSKATGRNKVTHAEATAHTLKTGGPAEVAEERGQKAA